MLLWILTLKIQGQDHSSRSHSGSNTLSTRIPFVPCQSTIPFLRWHYFATWPCKFKVKVMSGIKVKGHITEQTSYWLTSLLYHVNDPHSWESPPFISKFNLENPRSRSHSGSNILLTHIPFIPCQLTLTFLRYGFFKIWPWKSKVKAMGAVKRSRSHS